MIFEQDMWCGGSYWLCVGHAPRSES